MKAKDLAPVAAGKTPKVDITAVMRKLIILANALLKANRTRTPTRLTKTDTLTRKICHTADQRQGQHAGDRRAQAGAAREAARE